MNCTKKKSDPRQAEKQNKNCRESQGEAGQGRRAVISDLGEKIEMETCTVRQNTGSQYHKDRIITQLWGYTRVASHNMQGKIDTKRTMLWPTYQRLEKK